MNKEAGGSNGALHALNDIIESPTKKQHQVDLLLPDRSGSGVSPWGGGHGQSSLPLTTGTTLGSAPPVLTHHVDVFVSKFSSFPSLLTSSKSLTAS